VSLLHNQKIEQPAGGRESLETVVREDCRVQRDGFVGHQTERRCVLGLDRLSLRQFWRLSSPTVATIWWNLQILHNV
jgi:hypothetical protein